MKSNMQTLALPRLFADCYEVKDGVPEFKLFINGEWQLASNGRRIPIRSPIDGNLIATVQAATASDVDKAVNAAYGARRPIRDIPPLDRTEVLNRARHSLHASRQDLATTMVLDAAKS